jgi:hypothetical protein
VHGNEYLGYIQREDFHTMGSMWGVETSALASMFRLLEVFLIASEPGIFKPKFCKHL